MPLDVTLPQWGMGMNDAVINKWLKKEGDHVKKGDPIVEVEAAKVTGEVESPSDGMMGAALYEVGSVATVGAKLCSIFLPGEPVKKVGSKESSEKDGNKIPSTAISQRSTAASMPIADASTPSPSPSKSIAPPRVRALAKSLGVPLESVQGTGTHGRITEDDVQRFAQMVKAVTQTDTVTQTQSAKNKKSAIHSESELRIKEIVPLVGMQGTIARRMTDSIAAPQVTLHAEVDVTKAMELLRRLLPAWRSHRMRPRYQDLVLMALSRALKETPSMNSHVLKEAILLFEEVNIGLAIASNEGLVVPVIKNASEKTLLELAKEVRNVASAVKEGKIRADLMQGSTFTVTDLSGYGVSFFNPLLNPPEVAILGICRIKELKHASEKSLPVRVIGSLALTFDHRAVNGAPAGNFLSKIVRYLESPDWITLKG